MIRAVVLDVDDTLCLTEQACFELENEVLARMGRDAMDRDIHLHTWGMPLLEGIAARSPGVDLAEFYAVYQPRLRDWVRDGRLDTVTPQTLSALDALIEDRRTLMLLTSRTHDEVHHLVAAPQPLSTRIAALYHADNTHYLKPDGRVFDVLLRDHSLEASACVYVGDSPSDALAANEAGMSFIACLAAGVRTRRDFAGTRTAHFVQNLGELVDIVHHIETNSLYA